MPIPVTPTGAQSRYCPEFLRLQGGCIAFYAYQAGGASGGRTQAYSVQASRSPIDPKAPGGSRWNRTTLRRFTAECIPRIPDFLAVLTGLEPAITLRQSVVLTITLQNLVGNGGFEPPTSRSQSARATGLRQSPWSLMKDLNPQCLVRSQE